eukprot:400225-Pleurochrysis_carterae.AAC.1
MARRPMTKLKVEKKGKGGNRERGSFQGCHGHALNADRYNKWRMQGRQRESSCKQGDASRD